MFSMPNEPTLNCYNFIPEDHSVGINNNSKPMASNKYKIDSTTICKIENRNCVLLTSGERFS